ncbi:MAG: slipin family protein [Candidatus Eisenbacteria bacterium]|uniref:Slipin family protein n=1 Tax=Eiseniibacteriota bacterium TaxID=2212470 RepID=A0A7Y2EDD9_UNCEI|nr:slipin family protein [Candidatus Eisenbacteria bacterium]
MWLVKRVQIDEVQRGILYLGGQFQRVLEPGTHWIWSLTKSIQVVVWWTNVEYEVTEEFHVLDFLTRKYPEQTEKHLQVLTTTSDQIGYVFMDGVIKDVMGPGDRRVVWRDVLDVRLEVQSIEDSLVPDSVMPWIWEQAKANNKWLFEKNVTFAEIGDGQCGLLKKNGEVQRVLSPGRYAYWRFLDSVTIKVIDQRLRQVDVAGQEILTQDKVTLRINVTGTYQVKDPVAASTQVVDYEKFIYSEIQFALRGSVGTKTLEEILADKSVLNSMIRDRVHDRVAGYGIELSSVGVKDIILPGEMKILLNRVVEAEKAAEANLVRRREETAATRSLANTAKMMENNPMLMRLKELEALEKVTERIDNITVFGGLDGVMKQLLPKS